MTDFAEKISKQNLTPLWNVLSSLITQQPKSQCLPHLWKYAKIRPAIMEAGTIISAKEAVRRVLILENPGLKSTSKITTSLYAGLQLVLPGEVAPCHRHSQSALRFVLEGGGAHTSVNGEQTFMQPGDFIITPSHAWHDHGNTSSEPMVWLDGLDIPMVQFFDASFLEDLKNEQQTITNAPDTSLAKYGQGLLPLENKHTGKTSPIFNYPYARSRVALEHLAKAEQWNKYHGLKLHYSNPLTGGHAMVTMATFLQLLPTGLNTQPYRATDATVFVCVEGSGHSIINGQKFNWSPRDIFVVPSWQIVTHHAEQETIFFSYSDRAAQEKLGLWKEEKL